MKHCYLEILLKKPPGPWIIIKASEIFRVPQLKSVSQVKEKLRYSLDDFSRRLFVFIYEKLGEGWTAYIYLRLGEGYSPVIGEHVEKRDLLMRAKTESHKYGYSCQMSG